MLLGFIALLAALAKLKSAGKVAKNKADIVIPMNPDKPRYVTHEEFQVFQARVITRMDASDNNLGKRIDELFTAISAIPR